METFNGLDGVTSQNMEFFIATAMRISNPSFVTTNNTKFPDSEVTVIGGVILKTFYF
jgi:Mg2+/Co2+ transporter CorC